MQKAFKLGLISASVMLAVVSQQAQATNGYAAHGFGSVQKAMGGAAVAGHENAMNIATNPASMSFGTNNWTAGAEVFVPHRGMNHAGRGALPDIPLAAFFPPAAAPGLPPGAIVPASGAIPGADLKGNDDQSFGVPEFAYQRNLGKFAVGVAAYGNGGMNATYDRAIFGSPTGHNTGIDFAQLFITPAVSMKINEKNSIGASLNLVYQRMRVDGVNGFAPFSSDAANLSDNGYDSSTGAGLSVGWQGKLTDALTFGLAYRSKTNMSKFDKYKGLMAEQGDFDIPSMLTGGISYQATPKTILALDIARINYTDVKAISNKNNTAALQQDLIGANFGFPAQNPDAPKLGDENGAGFGWKDQTVFKIGMKHQLNNKIALMAGYNHGKSPIDSTQTAFNVLAPATVEDHVTLGLDYKLTKNSSVAVQYMHAFENEIKGDASRAPNGAPLSPGAQIPIGQNPFTDFTAANLKMYQDSFGVAYSRNF